MAKDFYVTNVLRTQYCDNIVDAVDVGPNAGKLRIYDDSAGIPASADDPVLGNLLVEIDLAEPAFGPASNGLAQLIAPPAPGVAIATGTASYFRLVDGSATPATVGQGTCGEIADNPDLTLSNKAITVNDEVTLQTLDVFVANSLTTVP